MKDPIFDQVKQINCEPSADGYGQILRFRRGDRLSFQAFADAQFTVDQILG